MAPEDQSNVKHSVDEVTEDQHARVEHKTQAPKQTRPVYITVHFNNIAIDVSFRLTISEDTTIDNLYDKINAKLTLAFVEKWDNLRKNDLVSAENSLRAVLEGTMRRDLYPELFQRNRHKDSLDLSKYNDTRHQNLWDLVEETWRHNKPSALRLNVVIANRVILGNQLKTRLEQESPLEEAQREQRLMEEQRRREGKKPLYKLDKNGMEDYNYDGLFGEFDFDGEFDSDGETDTKMDMH